MREEHRPFRPPLIPQLCRLSSASDTHSRSNFRRPLGPHAEPAIHRSDRTACLSSTSAIITTCEHTIEDPTLDHPAVNRPLTDSAEAPAECSQCQGLKSTKNILSTPTATPLSPWIYPDQVCSDTLCRVLMPHLAWIARRGDYCGSSLSRTSSPDNRHPKATFAVRAVSLPSHDG